MKKEPREYISPLLHPPLNRLFISRPRLEPFKSIEDTRTDFSCPDKPKPVAISQSDLDRLFSYVPPPQSGITVSRVELLKEQATARKAQKDLNHQKKLTQFIKRYRIPKLTGDPFKTIFLGRLPYDISDRQLRRELAPFGNIIRINLLANRGIAFVEFERERDARRFARDYEEIKIEGRRVVVDVERARTVEGWLPRRFGGGLGGRSAQGRDPKARVVQPSSSYSSSTSSSNTSSHVNLPSSTTTTTGHSVPPLPPPQKQLAPEPLTFQRVQVEYGDI